MFQLTILIYYYLFIYLYQPIHIILLEIIEYQFLEYQFGDHRICVVISTMVQKHYSKSQRWSPRGRPWPRGQILKSLASRPQVLENWPVLGSRTAVFFELLKFCRALEKFFGKTFFCGDRLKNFCEDLFFFSEIA